MIKTSNLITKKDLPLSPERLAEVRAFCEEQVKSGSFRVLGQISRGLRIDWQDESLPEAVRANGHVHIRPDEWRVLLERTCSLVLDECLKSKRGIRAAFLMWRAALAFYKTLALHDVYQCHIDVKRDEKTLGIIERMPLDGSDREILGTSREDDRVLIPDPMLASGSSASYAVELLNGFGIQNSQITVGCVVAAPEGVFNLLNRFPGINIIAATLDGCLNGNAYIVDKGLGDAGEKYFCGNSIGNFSKTMFTDAQWAHLKTYFKY